MKIIFCGYDGKNIINGINAWLLRLLPDLQNNGHQVVAIFLTGASEDQCTTIPILRQNGIECLTIPFPHYTESIISFLVKVTNQIKPDVFVPGNLLPALYASKWIRNAGITTIGILHNDDDEYEAILNEFVDDRQEYLSKIVAVSEVLYQKAKQKSKGIKVIKIPYGAPVSTSKSTLTETEKFKVFYVGRLAIKQKNIDKIAEAFCKIAKNIDNTEAYIFGSGPDTGIVEHIFTKHKNLNNIYLKGNLPNAELREQLLSAHVIVLLSDYEGIPVAILEAMGCGVVPICKKIDSGIPELLFDSETGYYVNDNEELIDKVKYLQSNPQYWESISTNAKNLIESKFSSKKNLEQWLSIIADHKICAFNNIKLPRKLKLPPPHQHLIGGDRRNLPIAVKLLLKGKQAFSNYLLKRD